MLFLFSMLSFATFTSAQITLGTAASFGVLSLSSVTNTGPTKINGDIGTAGSSITGFPPGNFTGAEAIGSSEANTPLDDARTAYNALAGLNGATVLTGDLGGMSLAPGTYSYSSPAAITGSLTLAGTGSASDAWYFQIGSSLITASGSSVLLTGGGLACNVFWQVGTSATLGTGSAFQGNILADASVTLDTTAVINGGVFALGATVTLDDNVVNVEKCPVASPLPPSSAPGGSPTPTVITSSSSASETLSTETTTTSSSASSSTSSSFTSTSSSSTDSTSSSSVSSSTSSAPTTTSTSSGSSSTLTTSSSLTTTSSITQSSSSSSSSVQSSQTSSSSQSSSSSTLSSSMSSSLSSSQSSTQTSTQSTLTSTSTCKSSTTSSTSSKPSSSCSTLSSSHSSSSSIPSSMPSASSTTSVTISTSRITRTIHVTITSHVSGCTPLPRRGLNEDLKLAAVQEPEIAARDEGVAVERTYEERIGKVIRNVLGR